MALEPKQGRRGRRERKWRHETDPEAATARRRCGRSCQSCDVDHSKWLLWAQRYRCFKCIINIFQPFWAGVFPSPASDGMSSCSGIHVGLELRWKGAASIKCNKIWGGSFGVYFEWNARMGWGCFLEENAHNLFFERWFFVFII